MSGFIGWVDFKSNLNERISVIEHMTRTMSKRGPDSEKIYVSSMAAIGYRDLQIGGTTRELPAVINNPAHRVALVYNGQIFNISELKSLLEAKGISLHGIQDSELLIQAYLHWGSDFISKLDGEFSLLLWDGGARQLILARDRMGIKPLYFYQYADGILVASEPKGIMANPIFKSELDFSRIPILLQPRLVMPGETPLKGLEQVPPASYMTFSPGRRMSYKYWQLASEEHRYSFDGTQAHVRELLEQSVLKRTADDNSPESIAGMLSGGLDSTSIVAMMNKFNGQMGNKRLLQTYCMQFDSDSKHFTPSELRPDIDSPYAAMAAEYFGLPHTTVTATMQDILNTIPATRECRDLPAWGQFDASMYLLFSEIGRKHRLVLTGEIADEIFGGYPYFFNQALIERKDFPWLGDGPRLSDYLTDDINKIVNPREDERGRYNQLLSEVPRLSGESAQDSRIREIFYLGMAGPVTVLLERMERMSSVLGVEVRFPFCDYKLVQYMWNVPWHMKAEGGTKGLLKHSVFDLLPKSTLERKKSAYPHIQNPQYDNYLIDAALRLTRDTTSAVYALFDCRKLNVLLQQIRDNRLTASLPGGARPATLLVHLIEMEQWIKDYKVAL